MTALRAGFLIVLLALMSGDPGRQGDAGAPQASPVTVPPLSDRPAPPAGPPELPTSGEATTTRLHAILPDGREWLFEQNPVDPRRATGWLVVHAARVIVVYEDSDLRNWLGLRGWADVLALERAARVKTSTDAARTLPLQQRFPKYRVSDLADWLEK